MHVAKSAAPFFCNFFKRKYRKRKQSMEA
jgi:hypothetical protein